MAAIRGPMKVKLMKHIFVPSYMPWTAKHSQTNCTLAPEYCIAHQNFHTQLRIIHRIPQNKTAILPVPRISVHIYFNIQLNLVPDFEWLFFYNKYQLKPVNVSTGILAYIDITLFQIDNIYWDLIFIQIEYMCGNQRNKITSLHYLIPPGAAFICHWTRSSLMLIMACRRFGAKHLKDAGPCLNIHTVFPRYGDYHAKDKTIARPSYL